jgi:hypothetical protein
MKTDAELETYMPIRGMITCVERSGAWVSILDYEELERENAELEKDKAKYVASCFIAMNQRDLFAAENARLREAINASAEGGVG